MYQGNQFIGDTIHKGWQKSSQTNKDTLIECAAQLPGAEGYTNCRPPTTHLCNECPGYDTKPGEGEAPVLELWGVWSTPSLPLLPVLLWPNMILHVRVASMGQIELFILETV